MRNHAFFSISFTTSFFSVLFLCILITIPILDWKNTANFDQCTTYVNNLPQNCSDPDQVCLYNATGGLENLNLVYITAPACKRLCGPGFQAYPMNDILQRFFQWVAPAIVLLAHYHFPPLPVWNYIAIMFHLLGNPVDCLWSMLCRIQVGRVFYHKAKKQDLSCSVAVATIWCAYDEIGYQDSSGWFLHALQDIRDKRGTENFLRNSVTEPLSKRATLQIEQAAQQLISHRAETALTTWIAIFGLIAALGGSYVRTWVDRENNQTAHMIATVALLFVIVPIIKLSGNIGAFTSSIDAIDIIQKLRLELGPNYPLFPSFSFPNIDRWDGRQVEHLYEPAYEDELANLAPGSPAPSKPYPMRVSPIHTEDFEAREQLSLIEWKREIEIDTLRMLQQWPNDAAYKGMNCTWRPQKHVVIGRRRSVGIFLLSYVFTMTCSYVPAICIAYYTPLKGFSCRSLAWTTVAILWTWSIALDFVYKSLGSWSEVFGFSPSIRRLLKPLDRFSKAKSLLRITVVKDSTITFIVTAIVIAQQLGLYNSCWCQSGGVTEHMKGFFSYVNLTPFSSAEWTQGWILWASAPTSALLLIVAFIAFVELYYSDSGKLLNRSQSDKDKNLIRIKWLQRDEAMKDL